jgi:hypothetical protein
MSIDGNVDGYAVTSNLVHDNDNIGIDSIGFEKVSPNPTYDQARNGEVRGNIVYNITSYGNPDYGKQYAADGIYVDGGTNIVIEQNLVYATDLGLELASEHGDTADELCDGAQQPDLPKQQQRRFDRWLRQAGGVGRTTVTIVNNTLFDNDTKSTGSGEFQIQWYATNNVFENNIVYAGAQGLFVHSYTASEAEPAALDYNIYFGAIGASAAHFQWNKTILKGFAAYRTKSMQDVHSQFVDPLFISTSLPNLDLRAGSPALGAGTDLGAGVVGTADVAGNPRVNGGSISIGAYEN